MKTNRDVIDSWPSHAEFEQAAKCGAGGAAKLKHRNSIPSKYWLGIVEGAVEQGIEGVTLKLLAELAANGGELPEPAPTSEVAACAS